METLSIPIHDPPNDVKVLSVIVCDPWRFTRQGGFCLTDVCDLSFGTEMLSIAACNLSAAV